MPLYNIIYRSPDKKVYLWNGSMLDPLKNPSIKNLYFSGKTFKHDELDKALKQCLDTVHFLFPGNMNPQVMPQEVKISK